MKDDGEPTARKTAASAWLRAAALAAAAALFLSAGYGWLAFGIFQDREFSTLYLFSKHRWSTRFYFHAPIGESDKPLSSLSPASQQAEKDFNEFIGDGGGYFRKHRLFSP